MNINVKKKYEKFAVDISYSSSEIGITAVLGPSGAGKTSLINMISGLIKPDTGHIRINGKTLFDSKEKINVPPEKRGFGYVFQEGRLFPHLCVESNLTYGMKLVPEDKRFIQKDKVIELLDLKSLLKRQPSKLSGGEKQRVAIGRALLTSPGLLLMDEPLASLDDMRKNEVLPFIRMIAEIFNVPVLYVTHSLDEVKKIADKILVVNGGRIKLSGDAGGVFVHNDFEKITGAVYH